jgi:hypothetical protein
LHAVERIADRPRSQYGRAVHAAAVCAGADWDACMRERRARHGCPPHRREGRTAAAACRRRRGPGRACPTRRVVGRSNRARSRPQTRVGPRMSHDAGPGCLRSPPRHWYQVVAVEARMAVAPSTRRHSRADPRRRHGCRRRRSGRIGVPPRSASRIGRSPSAARRRPLESSRRPSSRRRARRAAPSDRDGRRSPGRRSPRPTSTASTTTMARVQACVASRPPRGASAYFDRERHQLDGDEQGGGVLSIRP